MLYLSQFCKKTKVFLGKGLFPFYKTVTNMTSQNCQLLSQKAEKYTLFKLRTANVLTTGGVISISGVYTMGHLLILDVLTKLLLNKYLIKFQRKVHLGAVLGFC